MLIFKILTKYKWMNMKIKLLLLAISAMLVSSSNARAMEQKEKKSLAMEYGSAFIGNLVGSYGAVYSGALVHELGHAVANKLCIKNCKNLIYVDPFLGLLDGRYGSCMPYSGGSLTISEKLAFLKLANRVRQEIQENPEVIGINEKNLIEFKKKHNIEYIDTPRGLKGAAISAAGPLAGLSYCVLLPFLNTIFHEYSQSGSIIEAVQRASKRNYINEDQNPGVLLGSMVSAAIDVRCLLSPSPGSDGWCILQDLKLNPYILRKPAIRFSATAIPFVGFGFLGYSYLSNLLNKK
jgi:hypothetical protein